MRVLILGSLFACCAANVLSGVPAEPAEASVELKAAIALFDAHRYPDAEAALTQLLRAEPTNARACHFLGRTLITRNDKAAWEEGLKWLAKAVELEPNNAIFLGVFGGASLQQAGRNSSISAATKGRDAMEKALTIAPDYLDAREGLFQFYQRAPWPLGSSAKAAVHLAGIRQRDPDRATVLEVLSKANAKDFPGAFALCEIVLERNPDNYVALYQYGRTASVSGNHLERGLACLQRCLTAEPPTPASPTHSHVWQRIGNIQEKLQHPADARAAYESALRIDSTNRQASEALARMK